jgi:mannosyltransferase
VTRSTIVALVAVLALGSALRFHRLDRESLWVDEIFSVEIARQPWPALLAATGQDGHPPLYDAALRIWIGAFGESEATVRRLSAVMGVLTLAAFFALAARLLPTSGALIATLLLACSPYHVYYSQEARNYALLLLLTVLSYLGLVVCDERPERRGRALAYVAATVLLLYTHVYGFFVWAAQIPWITVRARKRDDWWARLWPTIAIGVLVLPWFFAPWTALLLRQTNAGTTGLHLARPTLWAVITSVYQFTGSPFAAVVVLPAAALEVYHALRVGEGSGEQAEPGLGSRSKTSLLLLWGILPQLVPFTLSQFTAPIYITRATIVTLPVLYLLAAGALGRMAPRWRFGVVSVAVLGSLGTQALYFNARSKEQWREAAATVDARAQPGDVVLFDAGYGRRGFDYYSHAPGLRRMGMANDLTSAAGAAELSAVPADARRLWVVRFQRPPGRDRVVGALAARYHLAGFAPYQGIELFLFEE